MANNLRINTLKKNLSLKLVQNGDIVEINTPTNDTSIIKYKVTNNVLLKQQILAINIDRIDILNDLIDGNISYFYLLMNYIIDNNISYLIIYFAKNQSDLFTMYLNEEAADNNFDHIIYLLKFIPFIDNKLFNYHVADSAAYWNQLKVIQILRSFDIHCTHDGADYAIANNHLDILLDLYNHKIDCSNDGVLNAISDNNKTILVFLYNNYHNMEYLDNIIKIDNNNDINIPLIDNYVK